MGILSHLFRPRSKDCPGVYVITNRRTGCIYIGATTKPMTERWARHRYMLNTGRHHNKRLQEDWTQYGARAFKFAVLEVEHDPINVFKREEAWQRLRHTEDGCYNPSPDRPFPWKSGRERPPVDYESEGVRMAMRKIYYAVRVQTSLERAREILAPLAPAYVIERAEAEFDPNRNDWPITPKRSRTKAPAV